MHRIRPELAAWHQLNSQLEDARLRLQAERCTSCVRPRKGELESEIEQLEQECEKALEAIYSAIAARPMHEVVVAPPAPGSRMRR